MNVGDWMPYIFGRLKDVRPVTVDLAGQVYAVRGDGTLGDPVRALAPQWEKPVLNVSTLGALAAAVKWRVDDFEPDMTVLHVTDYDMVELVSIKADEFGKRHIYARAHYTKETPFVFNQFWPVEKFLIDFRASFDFNDEAVKVATVVSNLESGQAVTVADDGLSQAIEIKSGTITKTPVVLPADGIPLIAWRTFREAAPVVSKFLLRLKGMKDALPQVALYEIDQKWKLETAQSVARWLEDDERCTGVEVIA
jgi:hypothetical protein